MGREPLATFSFALVVVRRGEDFLVVHEAAHGQTWYLPAGGVEPGETFPEAARREVLEEAGIPVVLEGILRLEHTPLGGGAARLRVVFLARPADATPPKQEPDEHSLEARWVRRDELAGLTLRNPDPLRFVDLALAGGPAAPLALLDTEDHLG